ncbi:hypothetical protein [Chromobacterium violaceum]|uniref:hypothetical protein n=1 Tax=Chromobacterium violaceum TaxID=536 RepID=UPI001C8BDF0E|nr:hypothetical protein [Chromobacterium violaceum]MBX9267505.1 hypothetical protein [Chromobacterium violaceum]
MPIPTKEEFEAALSFDLWGCLSEPLEAISLSNAPERDIEETARSAWKQFQESSAKFEALPAYQWLNSQPAYQMATRKLFMQKNNDGQSFITSIIQSAKRDRDAGRDFLITASKIEDYAPKGGKWIRNLLLAIYEYHHQDPAKKIASSRENIITLLNSAQEFIPALESAYNDSFLKWINIPKFRKLKGGNNLTEALMRIKNALDEGCLYPSTRVDRTLRERFFIYSICASHYNLLSWEEYIGPTDRPPDWWKWKYWKFNIDLRPDVITDLLYLDGIENQIDIRRVEEHCKAYLERTKKRRKVKQSDLP